MIQIPGHLTAFKQLSIAAEVGGTTWEVHVLLHRDNQEHSGVRREKRRHSRWNSQYVFQDQGEICFLIAKTYWKDRRSAFWVCHELWHPGRDCRCHKLHKPSCLHKLLSQPLTNEFQFLTLDLMLEWFSCSPSNSTVFINNFTLNSLQEWPFGVSRTITSPWQLPHRCLKANHHCTLIWLCLVLVIPPMNSQASQALRKELGVSSVQVHFCQEEPFLDGCRTVGYWKAEDCSSSQRAVPIKTPAVTTSWGQHPVDTARGNRLASASYHLLRLAEKINSSSDDYWLRQQWGQADWDQLIGRSNTDEQATATQQAAETWWS